jgi:hypothetical protein
MSSHPVPAPVIALQPTPNPIPNILKDLPALALPEAKATAVDLLRQPLPAFTTVDGSASTSADANINFHHLDFIHFGQDKELFKGYGGFPNNMEITARFYPINAPDSDHLTTISDEPEAVNAGRNYVLLPVYTVLQRRVPELQYNVEVKVTTSPIRISSEEPKGYEGFVDAIFSYKKRHLVMCEFKRPGCFNLNRWGVNPATQQRVGPSLGTEAQKISRQVMKYAYATGRPYFILSDWKNFLFIHLDNEQDNKIPKEAYVEYSRRHIPPPANMPGRFEAKELKRGDNNLQRFRGGNAGWPHLTARAAHCNDPNQHKILVYAFVMEAYIKEKERRNVAPPGDDDSDDDDSDGVAGSPMITDDDP